MTAVEWKRDARSVVAFGLSLLVVPITACGSPDLAPELDGLVVGEGYDAVVSVAGKRCEILRDEGVRAVVWSYEDGSSVEAGVYDGTLSGLTVSGASAERRAKAIWGDDATAAFLHETFGDDFVTIEDTSDRDCRWRWDDGRLTATFERGSLREAIWFPADGSDARLLVEVTDETELVFRGLAGQHPSERYRALSELAESNDPRLADELVAYLGIEKDKVLRGKAALILARMGERRASDLLLADLEEPIVNVDVLRALGKIGDLRAERALRDALHEQGSYRLQSEIQSARAQIRHRLGMPSPDRR